MQRLKPTAGLLCATLVLSVGAWWLASVSLLAGTGFADTTRTSSQAALVLVLGQWCLIALFAGRERAETIAASAASALAYVLPLWPLLSLLWLSSRISMVPLIVTQVVAVAIVLLMVFIDTGFERLSIDARLRDAVRSAAGVAVAVAIWTGRNDLHAWMTA